MENYKYPVEKSFHGSLKKSQTSSSLTLFFCVAIFFQNTNIRYCAILVAQENLVWLAVSVRATMHHLKYATIYFNKNEIIKKPNIFSIRRHKAEENILLNNRVISGVAHHNVTPENGSEEGRKRPCNGGYISRRRKPQSDASILKAFGFQRLKTHLCRDQVHFKLQSTSSQFPSDFSAIRFSLWWIRWRWIPPSCIHGRLSLKISHCCYQNSLNPIHCNIYRPFCAWALSIAKQFGLIAAAFFTHPCAVDYIFYNFIHRKFSSDSLTLVSIKGLPMLEIHDLPSFTAFPNTYPANLKMTLSQFTNLDKADFILINSFYHLERTIVF